MKCPWCSGPLHSTKTGLMCRACMVYYERDKWWRVSCDENHAHGEKCLIDCSGEVPKSNGYEKKGGDLKTAIVVGPKAMKYLAEIGKIAGVPEDVALKRALAMYRTIKRMEKNGYKPCMLKDRTARLLKEE